MTDENENLYTKEQLDKMFNTDFLPILQEIARNVKKQRYSEEEIAFFHTELVLNFTDLENPLTFENLSKDMRLQLRAVTRKEIEEAEDKKNESE